MERKQAISPGQEAIKTISPVQEEIKAFVKAHIDSSRFNFRHDYGNSLAFDLVNGAYSIIVHPVDYNITIGKDQKPKLKSSLSVMNFEKSQGQASSTRPESREPNPMFLPGPETYLIPVFYG
ncbi:MAG TPA: hypothetical protein VKE88_04040, partial [Candidatus Nanoarchaeia archaeon]|nr:hypothetical protein [Candidatus Nanoarchaeia archaeon]